ncbi:uncharacterized protein DFE_3245 [Desulfovibrio ferrophilus]|uniref:Uncharacterized protein n=1 Tax=Desulfovibrio ferrophilus TaxID=241368 RepID=A0A2Z6B3A5_9BACT|nr:uncharacterized protein DFE_3245 [Desulfovibrio ferrophilus]
MENLLGLEVMNQGVGTDLRAHLRQSAAIRREAGPARSSSIRTVTVGSGISPDLLTSLPDEESARGLPGHKAGIPPVGTSTPP